MDGSRQFEMEGCQPELLRKKGILLAIVLSILHMTNFPMKKRVPTPCNSLDPKCISKAELAAKFVSFYSTEFCYLKK